jgi:thiamine-phosphate pyrophosphorylase
VDVVVITNGDPDLARLAAILAAVPRGSVAIQIREKDLDGGPLLELARAIQAIAVPAGADVWINDRVDIAMLANVMGVHLPEHGLAVADVRAMSKLRVGCSRHTAAAARACDADVIQLGPIFETPGKRAIGLEPLTEASATRATLVAVGGIDSEERASLAVAAGADAVAVIRAAWSSPDPVAAVRALIAGVAYGRASRSR